jgi:hypothetical protein
MVLWNPVYTFRLFQGWLLDLGMLHINIYQISIIPISIKDYYNVPSTNSSKTHVRQLLLAKQRLQHIPINGNKQI